MKADDLCKILSIVAIFIIAISIAVGSIAKSRAETRNRIIREYEEHVRESKLDLYQIKELEVKYFSDGHISWREKAMLKALKENLNEVEK